MNRRDFLRTAGGFAGGAAAAGTAAGQETTAGGEGGGGGGGPPAYDGWFDGVGNYDGSTTDATGQDEVSVSVGAQGNGGGLAFDPPAVHVDNGATVVWEWTGEGGQHNVVADDDTFSSGDPIDQEGYTYEYTFEEDGIYPYICEPHVDLGMQGAIVVGSDYPTTGGGGEGGGAEPQDPHEMGVPFQPHFVGVATIVMMVVSIVFTFFLLKYGESAHTSGGNN